MRKKKKGFYQQGFEDRLCSQCPLAGNCRSKKGRRFYFVRYDEKSMRIAKRRQYERTPEFINKYRWRAGSEAYFPHHYERHSGQFS
jgi:hypothetical protein